MNPYDKIVSWMKGLFTREQTTENISTLDNYLYQQLEEIKSDLNRNNLQTKKDLYHLEKYFNKSPFLYIVIDINQHILKYNNTLKDTFTDKPSKIIGDNITTYIHEDDIELFKSFINSLNSNEDTMMFRILSNCGKLYYIEWHGIKLEDEQNYILFGNNITNEIELDEKIRNIINIQKVMMDNYPGSIICLNKYGKIIEFNKGARNITSYKIEEIANKHIYELFPDKDLFLFENINKIYKTKIRKKNGRKQIVYLTNTPLFDNNKKIGYTLIFHNEAYIKYLKKTLL